MRRKFTNLLLFILVIAASVGLTFYVGKGAYSIVIYNFVFLAVMAVLFLTGMFTGMFQIINMAKAFKEATLRISDHFRGDGKADPEKLERLNGIFENRYLDSVMSNFVHTVKNSPEGIAEIEEYINEDEIDVKVHRKLLEMVPDILTSLGILGTFVGLVWGLKNFEPSNYEAMTTSVASLVEGIKVAFLTSIYGISLSIIYSYGMRSAYSDLDERLQAFMEKFHSCVMPTAENESRNLLVNSTRQQIKVMGEMSERVAKEMAAGFERSMSPVFTRMSQSLDGLANAMESYQEEAVKKMVRGFLDEMNRSFHMQFEDFNMSLKELQRVQTQNTNYTSNLYRNFAQELSELYQEQEAMMKKSVQDLIKSMDNYTRTSGNLASTSLEIQKQQKVDYEHILSYMKDAEKTSGEFWVACNQAMQKYVEIAANSTEKVGNAGKISAAVIRENRGLLQTVDGRIKQYAETEQDTLRALNEMNRLLSEISAERNANEVTFRGKTATTLREYERLQKTIEKQGERQEELLPELIASIKELSQESKKSSRFSFFK